MSVNKIIDFLFENYYKRIGFSKYTIIIKWNTWKKRFIVAFKQINEKIVDPRNAKEYHQSFIRKKNIKSVKMSERITYQPKKF